MLLQCRISVSVATAAGGRSELHYCHDACSDVLQDYRNTKHASVLDTARSVIYQDFFAIQCSNLRINVQRHNKRTVLILPRPLLLTEHRYDTDRPQLQRSEELIIITCNIINVLRY